MSSCLITGIDFIDKFKGYPQELETLGDGNQEKNYFLAESCIESISCSGSLEEGPVAQRCTHCDL